MDIQLILYEDLFPVWKSTMSDNTQYEEMFHTPETALASLKKLYMNHSMNHIISGVYNTVLKQLRCLTNCREAIVLRVSACGYFRSIFNIVLKQLSRLTNCREAIVLRVRACGYFRSIYVSVHIFTGYAELLQISKMGMTHFIWNSINSYHLKSQTRPD